MTRLRQTLTALLLALSLPGAALAAITYVGGDGSSAQTAISIRGAHGEHDGIAAEYDWLKQHRPGWKPVMQRLVIEDGLLLDVLTIERAGKRQDLYFEISDFFGKSP